MQSNRDEIDGFLWRLDTSFVVRSDHILDLFLFFFFLF